MASQAQPQSQPDAQSSLHALLRLLTTGRSKLGLLPAMARIKVLQAAGLRSINDIASSDVGTIEAAIGAVTGNAKGTSKGKETEKRAETEKEAKTLLAACKRALADEKGKGPRTGKGDGKRAAETDGGESLTSASKRARSFYEDGPPPTPQEQEAALALPPPCREEAAIEATVLLTNRAPLVLVFVLVALKYVMPGQPLSSRLSLGQAVVSLNSRSRAVNLGLERSSAEAEGWAIGWPKVKVLGREVPVLKRGGYFCEADADGKEGVQRGATESESGPSVAKTAAKEPEKSEAQWHASSRVTLKKSTFIAHAIEISSTADAKSKLSQLLRTSADLASASHNITAFRLQRPGFLAGITEECADDGETGAGRHVMRILQEAGVFGVLVVVTRWYGGVMLGPDRWTLMSQVVREAIAQRARVPGVVTGVEALWGLDIEGLKKGESNGAAGGGAGGGLPVHRPEGARLYILKAFATAEPEAGEEGEAGRRAKKKMSTVEMEREKERNLGLLIGALEMLFESWVGFVGREELDRRAWGWYIKVRPEVESGVAGWGGKGQVRLKELLDLRRKG